MEYLPAEIQLKIFKYLNFDEIFTIKQINKYFYYFINKYEDELAHKRFNQLCFVIPVFKSLNPNPTKYEKKILKQDFETINFPLSHHQEEKWLSALDKQINVFIVNNIGIFEFSKNKHETLFIYLEGSSQKKIFSFELPLFPQNIEELKIVRFWLEQLSRCVFEVIQFVDFILNPEIIKLLFNNEEINKLKFNCESAYIHFEKIVNLKSILDHLVIGECLIIFKSSVETIEENNNILFNLLSNSGDRIPKVDFAFISRPTTLFNLILNQIETSTDLSKMVANIEFNCSYDHCFSHSKLIVNGVEMKESNDTKKCYKITNINDPKIIFLIKWTLHEDEMDLIDQVEINRLY